MLSRPRHLYLIGYRGCGKSTVARALAGRLGWPSVDTDERIEADCGRSIRSLFESEGENYFRDCEAATIAEVAALEVPSVVALGGGAILRESNRQQLQTSGRCVWLQASAARLFDRISADHTSADRRPALSKRGGFEEVVELLAAREPLYSQLAELTVLTEGKTPDEVVAEIFDWANLQAWERR